MAKLELSAAPLVQQASAWGALEEAVDATSYGSRYVTPWWPQGFYVRDMYLPTIFNGKQVLFHEGGRRYRVDNSQLQASSPGLGYRLAKNLENRDPAHRHEAWGAIVEGVNEGDGWVKVQVTLPQDTVVAPSELSSEDDRQTPRYDDQAYSTCSDDSVSGDDNQPTASYGPYMMAIDFILSITDEQQKEKIAAKLRAVAPSHYED